jgi:hypothetical protein
VRSKKSHNIDPASPFWIQPGAVLGSAVRHVASLSGAFDRVELRTKKGNWMIGREMKKPAALGRWELEVLSPQGKQLGVFCIESSTRESFTEVEVAQVSRVAKELGERWPRG